MPLCRPQRNCRLSLIHILFVAFLFGLLQYFKHAAITSLTQFSLSGYFRSYLDFSTPEHELTGY